MRWYKELFNPTLKCQRLGHDFKTIKVIIRKRSKGIRSVCEDYSADLKVCKRCGMKATPKHEQYKDYWTTVTMPDYMWKEMDEKGYVIVDE